MIIEMKIARGTQIWIDGKEPGQAWELGEENGRYTTTLRGEPLPIGPYRLEWIDFGLPDSEWFFNTGPGDMALSFEQQRGYSMRKRMMVKLEGWEEVEAIGLTIALLGDPEWVRVIKGRVPGEGLTVGIKLENGEWLELDETIAFVKAEVKWVVTI